MRRHRREAISVDRLPAKRRRRWIEVLLSARLRVGLGLADRINFLLASSALIPILGIALLIELRVQVPADLDRVSHTGAAIARLVGSVSVLASFVVAVLAEYVCLHGLEVGAVSHRDVRLVWLALAVLGFSIGVNLLRAIWLL